MLTYFFTFRQKSLPSSSKGNNNDDDNDNKKISIQEEKNIYHVTASAIEHEKAIDVWLSSICTYPNVDALFGEFSSEVFQVMLGLSMTIDANIATKEQLQSNDFTSNDIGNEFDSGNNVMDSNFDDIQKVEDAKTMNEQQSATFLPSTKLPSMVPNDHKLSSHANNNACSYSSDETRNTVFSSFYKNNAITTTQEPTLSSVSRFTLF